MQVIPLARNPREKKRKKKKKKEKKEKKKRKKKKKKKKKHVTALQFVPNHRYAIHVWKIVPRNHAVVICSDIFSHVYGSCRFHMFMVHVERSGTVLPFFCRGFYSITATQFMFGIWWPLMFTYLLSFVVYFIVFIHGLFHFLVPFNVLFMFIYAHLFSFIFIYFHLFSFIFISSCLFSFLLVYFHFFSFFSCPAFFLS